MRVESVFLPFVVLPLAMAGCGNSPEVNEPGGAPPCDARSACPGDAVPESACLEELAADRAMDGCGVFVNSEILDGNDANPGTKDRPVRSVQRAIELARTGRGRVFMPTDTFVGAIRLPSGVDIHAGFDFLEWRRRSSDSHGHINSETDERIAVIVEPARPGDTGAADGVSTLDHLWIQSGVQIGVLVQSNTAVEIVHSKIRALYGGRAGDDGEEWRPSRAAAGPDGLFGEDGCSAATIPGGAAVTNPCDDGTSSTGGKGGDGLPARAEDGDTGDPVPASDPYSGLGGDAEREDSVCENGRSGLAGSPGTVGAAGQGIGRLTETGWEGDRGTDGGRGTPGQGGGGGGGRRGGLAVCTAADKGGASGGSGGAGGCGGRGGRGGGNGWPSIGLAVLHARVTVRDSVIEAPAGGRGGHGGPPQQGGEPGRGAPGGDGRDRARACEGGRGGDGGDGGYGGPGRGGDVIGIAYLDEDQLTLEGVTFELGLPGPGGTSWSHDGTMTTGEDGVAVETLRFSE
ncbi:hypothetical protein WMF11_19585 [Sorangium sp. So ce295]|uniref:hypothetical protein n=1 Tax=Sorangium sp. So ce295 TaxID=3133295 RepID=UPI003F614FC1